MELIRRKHVKKTNFKSSFLFFQVSHIVNVSFEKMEIPQGGQKKEHDEGRSEPSRRKSM